MPLLLIGRLKREPIRIPDGMGLAGRMCKCLSLDAAMEEVAMPI
jgi:hypothetical protein